MELRQLRYFLSLARLRNFHRAADELHLSQQALSASISALERDLGVPLIVRSRQGAELTRYGEALVPRAQAMLGDARLARAELRGMLDATQGPVRAGVGAFFAHHVFPEALIRFVGKYPRVDVTVIDGTSSDLLAALLRGEVDFVVSTPAAESTVPPGLESELLFETVDAVFVGAQHPLASRRQVVLSDLVAWPWVLPGRLVSSGRLENAFRAGGLPPPERTLRADNVELIGRILSSSDAVALLGCNPFGRLQLPALAQTQCFRVPELAGPYRGVLAWRRAALLPAAANLIGILREIIAARLSAAS